MSLILAPNLRRSTNPAWMSITGSISNGCDWLENIVITDPDGTQLTGVSADTFALQLRQRKEDASAILSLTTASELTVTEGATTTTLGISADQSAVGGLDPGDYVIDIVVESSGVTGHVAHGRVSVFGAPIAI